MFVIYFFINPKAPKHFAQGFKNKSILIPDSWIIALCAMKGPRD